MRKITAIIAAGVIFAAPVVSYAGSVGVGLKAGTLGFGVDINYPISSMVTVGVGINKYSSSRSITADGIDYDTDLNLQTVSLLANIHPFAGSFHFTGGLMVNNNEFKIAADSASLAAAQVGNNTYTLDSLSGKVSFNKLAPYAGVGWGFSSSSGIGFTLEIGALMQGKPKVDLDATGTATANPTFQSDLKKEESNAEDDLKGFTMWPVFSAGIDIRF